LEEFLELAFSAVRLDWREHVELQQQLFRPTDILISRANPAKAKRVLNWEARYGLADIVTMMVEAEMDGGDRGGEALSCSRTAVP
jgi:GDPmannose 4,6-dehydratase